MTNLDSNVITLPFVITPESAVADPGLDELLDAARFQDGFDHASNHLAAMPIPWARQHARSTLAEKLAEGDDPSYTRGYRAALHGFLRHTGQP